MLCCARQGMRVDMTLYKERILVVIHWLKRQWRRYKDNCHKKRELSQENFRNLSQEIRRIADVSSKLFFENPEYQERIQRIYKEMDQLENLVDKKSFSRLPNEKKEELKKSLLVSREELLKSIQSAPCPTDRRQ